MSGRGRLERRGRVPGLCHHLLLFLPPFPRPLRFKGAALRNVLYSSAHSPPPVVFVRRSQSPFSSQRSPSPP